MRVICERRAGAVTRTQRHARIITGAGVLSTLLLTASAARATPSFSRQTQSGCGTCHTVFPQLTLFAREFKAGAYTLSTTPEIKENWQSSKRLILALAKVPPLSAMLIGDFTVEHHPAAGTKSSDVIVPDQFSLFYAGKIAPGLGTFMQVTYDSQADHFSFDNTDVRYAHKFSLFHKDLILGATLNNNPTVADLWNTTPAWGWPFITSGVWPGEGTNAALVDGSLAQAVVGLGGYAFWNNALYVQAAGYRSAPLGVARPLDGSDSNVIKGVAPYWRLAYDFHWGKQEIEVGTYGMYAALYPGQAAGLPLSGPSDKYVDVAGDASYQYYNQPRGTSLALQTTWIYEHRTPSASFPGETAHLNTFRVNANGSWRWAGASAGYFMTFGSRNQDIFGTQNGKPNTNGLIFGLTLRPWLNTLFIAQYTLYFQFDGASDNYDGMGRNATDNNTFAAFLWTSF